MHMEPGCQLTLGMQAYMDQAIKQVKEAEDVAVSGVKSESRSGCYP